ncbi:MAG: phBC6A51 family helix-turn-helix protein [Desulfuromonadaceae bacterium]|nr:phBC6A51 family helix-turn-helix protein [Desulfuromonadaceae bacterium]
MSANAATRRDPAQQKLKLVEPPADLVIQKQRAIQLLLEGKAVVQVAEEIGVDRTTVYRWLKEPSFIAERNRQANELRDAAQSRLRALISKSVDVVERQLEAGNLKAALAVLKSTGMMALDKPDTETDEGRLVKREVEKLAMDYWYAQPFAQQEMGNRPYHNRAFKDIVQMLDIELQAQHVPKESAAVTLICDAAAREAAHAESRRKLLEQIAQMKAKKG